MRGASKFRLCLRERVLLGEENMLALHGVNLIRDVAR